MKYKELIHRHTRWKTTANLFGYDARAPLFTMGLGLLGQIRGLTSLWLPV